MPVSKRVVRAPALDVQGPPGKTAEEVLLKVNSLQYARGTLTFFFSGGIAFRILFVCSGKVAGLPRCRPHLVVCREDLIVGGLGCGCLWFWLVFLVKPVFFPSFFPPFDYF